MEIHYQQDSNFSEYKFEKLQQSPFDEATVKFQNKIRRLRNLQKQKIVTTRKKKDISILKRTLLNAKVQLLTKNFLRKAKRNIVYKKAPQTIHFYQEQQNISLFSRFMNYLQLTEGIQFKPIVLCIWNFIIIFQTSIMVILFSIILAFPQTSQLQLFVSVRYLSLILYIFDMIFNFITQKNQIQGNKKKLKDIGLSYLRKQFATDILTLAIFQISNLFLNQNFTCIIILIALIKLKNNLKRFQNYEYIYVKTNTKEQYYSLIKVFLFNFTIGHLLSILLNLMANLTPSHENWHSKINIENAIWHQKYIWGYYWGTNIMLTVGFGDLSAANKIQAAILIFIQTISCVTLAYNINCVGSIIGAIKAQNEQKKKKLKYFYRMCQENNISEDLSQKIKNIIEQTYLIKQLFQNDQFEGVMESLPKNIQSQYRKEANKSLFTVGFFNSLKMKTILNLAEYIHRKVAHPSQIIQKKGEIENFCILQKGCFGLAYRNGPISILNGTVIEKFEILQKQNPKILSLHFIKRKLLKYDIKSMYYSVYYYLTCEELMKVLQQNQIDHQFLHYMKDKDDNIIGSYEIYKCKVCQDDYHLLFECPHYHYTPIKEFVILKSLSLDHNSKNKRDIIMRNQRFYRNFRSLFAYILVKQDHQKFLRQNYEQIEINEIKNIKKYYQELNLNQINKKNKNIDNSLEVKNKSLFEHHFKIIENMVSQIGKIKNDNLINFWSIQSDQAYNYKHYFKQYNPNRLNMFTMYSHKRKKKYQTFGTYAYKKLPHNPAMNKVTKSFLEVFFNQNQPIKELDQMTNGTLNTNYDRKLFEKNIYLKTL